MGDAHLVQLSPAPGRRIGAQFLARVVPGCGEGGVEQGVARSLGIGAEPRIGAGQQSEQDRGRNFGDELAAPLGDDRGEHPLAQLAPQDLEQGRRSAVCFEPAIPAAQHLDRGLRRLRALGREEGDQLPRRRRKRVFEERQAVFDSVPGLRSEHIGDALIAIGIAEGESGDAVARPIGGQVVLVGGREPALGRIIFAGQRAEVAHPLPVVAPIARHRHQPVALAAHGHEADHLPAVIAVDVGIMKVGRGGMEGEGVLQAFPVAREVDRDHRECAAAARLHVDRRDRGGTPLCRIVGDDGALHGIAQGRRPRPVAPDRNGDVDAFEALPAAFVAVKLGIVRIEFEDEQIVLVDMEIGASEGEAIGVALHDPRQAGGAAADHVQAGRGEMRDMAWTETAYAEMRIVGEDRSPGRAALRSDRPGIAARVRALRSACRSRIRLGGGDGAERKASQAQDAEIGLADGCGIETLGNRQRPCRTQGSDDGIQLQQAEPGEAGATNLVAGIAARHAARQDQIAQVPLQRADAKNAIFRRQQRRILRHLVDAGVDAGDIGAGTGQDVRRHAGELFIQAAAIMEQPRHRVMRGEFGAEGFGKAPHLAPVRKVDLKQSVACHDIALTEKGIGDGLGPDVGDAIRIVDDLDRCGRAGADQLAGAGQRQSRRSIAAGRQQSGGSGRAEQE